MLVYSLEPADLAAFAAWRAHESGDHAERRPRQRVIGAWLAGIAGYLLVSVVATIPLLFGRQLPWAAAGEVLALAAGVAAGWWEWQRGRVAEWLLSRPYLRKAKAALAATGAERRLSWDDKGIQVAVGDRSETIAWSAISRVVQTDDHVFLFTGPSAAHVVPRRAGSELDALLAHLRPSGSDA